MAPRYAFRITKVLHVLPNHPSMQPGGAPETYALELHQAMLQSEGLEPVLVGRTGAGRHRAGSAFSPLDGDPSQYLVRIEEGGFDIFHMTYGEKSLYTRFFADFLRAPGPRRRPPSAHAVRRLRAGVADPRACCPSTPIVYTLHDYMPICNRDGRLVRTDEALCLEASPRRCHECFPDDRPSRTSSSASGSSRPISTTSTCSSRPATSCSSATSTGASRGRRSGSRTTAARRRCRLPESEDDRPRTPARLLRRS